MASDRGGRFLDEEAAVRAVLAAVEDGLERMHAVHNRMLARRPGGELTAKDLRWLKETEGALADMARTAADKGMAGKYGKLLGEAFKKGATAAGNSMIGIDPDTIATALRPAMLEIKDLFEDGSRAITELTARAMVAGWSPRELSERIQSEVVLYRKGDPASPYGVPEWRAELQARNEPMKVYRETAGADWKPETLLEMIGPDDARTAGDICSRYVGKVMTLAEWEAAGARPRSYGWHPNCRHRWVKARGRGEVALKHAVSPDVGRGPVAGGIGKIVRAPVFRTIEEAREFLKNKCSVESCQIQDLSLVQLIADGLNTAISSLEIETSPAIRSIVKVPGDDWSMLRDSLRVGTVVTRIPPVPDLPSEDPMKYAGIFKGRYIPGMTTVSDHPTGITIHEYAHHLELQMSKRELNAIGEMVGGNPEAVSPDGSWMLTSKGLRLANRISGHARGSVSSLLAEGLELGLTFGWEYVPGEVVKALEYLVGINGGRISR